MGCGPTTISQLVVGLPYPHFYQLLAEGFPWGPFLSAIFEGGAEQCIAGLLWLLLRFAVGGGGGGVGGAWAGWVGGLGLAWLACWLGWLAWLAWLTGLAGCLGKGLKERP